MSRTWLRYRRPQGLALAVALLVLVIIVVLGFGLSLVGINHLNVSEMDLKSKQMEYVAEAGVVNAIEQLQNNSSFNTTGVPNPLTTALGNYTHSLGSENATVYVVNNAQGTATATWPKNNANVTNGTIYIYSAATGQDKRVSRSTGVSVRFNSNQGLFLYGIFGANGIAMTGGGNGFDGFDSYNSTIQGAGAVVGNKGTMGANNGTLDTAHFQINGGINTTGSVSYSGTGTPVTLPSPGTYSLPAVTKTAGSADPVASQVSGSLPPGAYGNLTSGETVTISQSGDYIFNNFDGTVIIPNTISGSGVRIFVEGTSAGGLPNIQNNAPNNQAKYCQVYCAPSVTGTVTFNGQSVGVGGTVTAAIYAPNLNVVVHGNSQIAGAVIANSYTKDGTPAPFHYDQTLSSMASPLPSFQILSWERL